MLALRPHVSVCPGDGGPPPVAPLPPPPPPALHLNPLLALPPVRGVPDGAAGEGTSADPGPDRGRGGVPDLTPGVEEGTEGPHPGGDVTGHDRAPPTERGSGSERGSGNEKKRGSGKKKGSERETGTEIGDGSRHADGRGEAPRCFLRLLLFCNTHGSDTLSFGFPSGLAPAPGRGAARSEAVGTVEATGGRTAAAAVPLSPPAAPTTVPPLTEEACLLPTLSVTS